ncbi:MAG: hypothetical protein Q4B61_03665 [Bacteroidales bacterium]|nr:hypothetical protein [Bacteroidales bacterium]
MNDVDIVNRINRHQNVRCLSTSCILVSATVASDKGSTTLGVRCLVCVVGFVEPVLTKSTVADSNEVGVGVGMSGSGMVYDMMIDDFIFKINY